MCFNPFSCLFGL